MGIVLISFNIVLTKYLVELGSLSREPFWLGLSYGEN